MQTDFLYPTIIYVGYLSIGLWKKHGVSIRRRRCQPSLWIIGKFHMKYQSYSSTMQERWWRMAKSQGDTTLIPHREREDDFEGGQSFRDHGVMDTESAMLLCTMAVFFDGGMT